MRLAKNKIISASLLLAVVMGGAGIGVAVAEGEDAVQEEVDPEDVAQEEASEVFADDADLAPPTATADGEAGVETPADAVEAGTAPAAEAAPVSAPDEAAAAAPVEPVAQSDAASDGAVLAAPGSTEESNGGGSSRPGSTPDT
jgi:hypothetical protein